MNFNTLLQSSSALDVEGARALRSHIKRELDSRVEAAARVKSLRGVAAGRSGKLFAGPSFQNSTRKDSSVGKAQKDVTPPTYPTTFKKPEFVPPCWSISHQLNPY